MRIYICGPVPRHVQIYSATMCAHVTLQSVFVSTLAAGMRRVLYYSHSGIVHDKVVWFIHTTPAYAIGIVLLSKIMHALYTTVLYVSDGNNFTATGEAADTCEYYLYLYKFYTMYNMKGH